LVSAKVLYSGLALLTVGNGGKGTRPWCFAEYSYPVNPGKFGLQCPRLVGGSGQAMRGSSETHAPAPAGNAGLVKEQVVLQPVKPTPSTARGNE